MEILVADDDAVTRRLLQVTLTDWGYSLRIAADGEGAWLELQGGAPPELLIVDWMMPRLDGPALCERVRATPRLAHIWVIMLTSRNDPADIVAGLEAGANDYVVKPFHRAELRARIDVGQRVLQLQHALSDRIQELEQALAQVHTLQGLIPICAYCKSIRNEREYWERVESYITARSDARFSHGICPECAKEVERKYGL